MAQLPRLQHPLLSTYSSAWHLQYFIWYLNTIFSLLSAIIFGAEATVVMDTYTDISVRLIYMQLCSQK